MRPHPTPRGGAKTGVNGRVPPWLATSKARKTTTTTTAAAKAKSRGLSRELAGLASWSGWKVSERDAEGRTEAARQGGKREDMTGRLVGAGAVVGETARVEVGEGSSCRADDNNSSTVSSTSGRSNPGSSQPTQVPSPSSTSTSITTLASTSVAAALVTTTTPTCPLCLCPLHGVNFPTIQCTDCQQTYHTACIGFDMDPSHHPYHNSQNPEHNLCDGCGCPSTTNKDDGYEGPVYRGHPSLLFHVREEDEGFREYYRRGREKRPAWADLM